MACSLFPKIVSISSKVISPLEFLSKYLKAYFKILSLTLRKLLFAIACELSSYFMDNVCSGWGCGTWQSYLSEYAYKYDAKYGSASLSAKDQVQKLINDNFTYDKLKAKYTICGSHDTNVLPLMIVATETQIGMDYYNHPSDYYAPNYMSGVAYFMNKNGVAASIAVRGLASGRLSTKK